MYKNKKILGIITARGESKNIPKKNIKIFAGKPLIAYTILAAKKSKYLTDFIVSTDSQKIFNIAKKYGAPVPFLRPRKLATDTSTSIQVVNHTLNFLKTSQKKSYDYVMILQPTSPLRTAKDIDQCIKKIVDTKADSVMSMVELTDFSLPKLKRIQKNGNIIPLLKKEAKQPRRRQAAEKIYRRNCAVYLTKTQFILKNDLFGKISKAYIMPGQRSIDINSIFDFQLAEFLFKKNHYGKN
ncbi:MAG: acylneuraminate cytidylyltransferase family protein [Patescibacteria group bacterium]